jgi:hypothetical protein
MNWWSIEPLAGMGPNDSSHCGFRKRGAKLKLTTWLTLSMSSFLQFGFVSTNSLTQNTLKNGCFKYPMWILTNVQQGENCSPSIFHIVELQHARGQKTLGYLSLKASLLICHCVCFLCRWIPELESATFSLLSYGSWAPPSLPSLLNLWHRKPAP